MAEPPLPPPYQRMTACRACPRLAQHLATIRLSHPGYYARPVRPWGRRDARLLIVGLAPGMHGANRTGRPFTADSSGTFLFQGLARAGFASDGDPAAASLRGVRITNAVRCLPPGNRPSAGEVRRCNGYLVHELHQLWRPRVRKPRCVLALGRIAHDAVAMAFGQTGVPFAHGRSHALAPGLTLFDCYHPSRQNTNTGRLTAGMLDGVLDGVARCLSGDGM